MITIFAKGHRFSSTGRSIYSVVLKFDLANTQFCFEKHNHLFEREEGIISKTSFVKNTHKAKSVSYVDNFCLHKTYRA